LGIACLDHHDPGDSGDRRAVLRLPSLFG